MAKKTYPTPNEIAKIRFKLNGLWDEYQEKLSYHKGFDLDNFSASWAAIRELGYLGPDQEKAWWDRHYDEVKAKIPIEELRSVSGLIIEDQIADLRKRSEGSNFNMEEASEWVAANFNVDDAMPSGCPHIIAWNMLEQCRKAPAQFWKEFMTRQLKKAAPEEAEEMDEDPADISELRAMVEETVHEYIVAKVTGEKPAV